MATLVLEDLNLVTLNQLLHRLDGKITIEQLREVVGTRELFTQAQAQSIEQYFGTVAVPELAEFDPVAKAAEFQTLVEKHAGDWYGDFSFPLAPFLPENLSPNLTLVVKRWEFGPKDVGICNPALGTAFWPRLDEVLAIIGLNQTKLAQLETMLVAELERWRCKTNTGAVSKLILSVPETRDTDYNDHFEYRFPQGIMGGHSFTAKVKNGALEYALLGVYRTPTKMQILNRLSVVEFKEFENALATWTQDQIEKTN